MADINQAPDQELIQCSRCKKKFFSDGFSTSRLGRRLRTCKECQARATGNRVYDAFVKGLAAKHGMILDDLDDYVYAGGNRTRHLSYFELKSPDEDLPPWAAECVCGVHIEENCYIRKSSRALDSAVGGPDLLILGNCCIKRFVPTCGRNCRDCGAAHNNRKVDLCNACRTDLREKKPRPLCADCGTPHRNRLINRCNTCRRGKCDRCGGRCSGDFRLRELRLVGFQPGPRSALDARREKDHQAPPC